MDVLRAMRVFRNVVECGSFVRAARSLDMTTAWASRQVAQLEEHLGTQLIHRTTRRLSLTDAGRLYLERCERIVDDIDDAERLLGNLNAAPRGLIRISAPMSFGLLHLAPLFAPFLHRYPEVTLDVTLDDRTVDLVHDGFDLAVRIAARLADSQLTVRRIGQGRRLLCASPAYLESHGTPRHARELENHACLRYALHASPGRWEFDGPGGRTVVEVRGSLTINNSIAIREAAVAGLGIALVPDFIVGPELKARKLREVLKTFLPSGYSVFAVSPPARYATHKVRAFVDFIAASNRLPSRAAGAAAALRSGSK